MEDIFNNRSALCPSARPESVNSVVFGVVNGTLADPRVTYLKQQQLVTDELIAQVSPVTPTEVFRTAAPCAESGCQHFDGKDCRLAQRVANKLPAVVEGLPPCSIRRGCRWWQQEGKAACMRCPQVITDNYNASGLIVKVATPTVD